MLQMVKDGKYALGDLIQPKSFTKFILGENGELTKSVFTISGRKIPMKDILSKLLKSHKEMGIMRENVNDRYLLMWADHAIILNNGYFIFSIKPIYSKTLYYSDKEMEELTSRKMDVQQIVEQPNVYMFARAQDSISEKLGYTQARLDDVLELRSPTVAGNQTVSDILRFFHGKLISKNDYQCLILKWRDCRKKGKTFINF